MPIRPCRISPDRKRHRGLDLGGRAAAQARGDRVALGDSAGGGGDALRRRDDGLQRGHDTDRVLATCATGEQPQECPTCAGSSSSTAARRLRRQRLDAGKSFASSAAARRACSSCVAISDGRGQASAISRRSPRAPSSHLTSPPRAVGDQEVVTRRSCGERRRCRRRIHACPRRGQAGVRLLGREVVPAVQPAQCDAVQPARLHRTPAGLRAGVCGRRQPRRAKARRALQGCCSIRRGRN